METLKKIEEVLNSIQNTERDKRLQELEQAINLVSASESREKIKEKSYTLNTLTTGAGLIITDTINGFVENILIDAEKPVQVLISSEKYPDIIIFSSNNKQIIGQNLIAVRQMAIDKNNNKFSYSSERFALNDKLRLEISGAINTKCVISIRYS
jgi:hypothetical protein